MKVLIFTIFSSALTSLATANSSGFLDPFEHLHFTERGTPIVHSFGIEPAFTGRDLFLDYHFRDGDGFSENEIELELEWAFTRRLGIILEVPYIFEKETGEPTADGFGDLAIVPRALLYEGERFLLTGQIEIVAPTGSSNFGGETAIAPGFSAWTDIGNWWTLNSQIAVEHIFDEDVTELIFGFGLVKTFGNTRAHAQDNDHSEHDHHTTEGLLNLHLEVTGTYGIEGEDNGQLNAEGLIGVSYGLTAKSDIRLAYEIPLTSPKGFDHGIVAGIIWHF